MANPDSSVMNAACELAARDSAEILAAIQTLTSQARSLRERVGRLSSSLTDAPLSLESGSPLSLLQLKSVALLQYAAALAQLLRARADGATAHPEPALHRAAEARITLERLVPFEQSLRVRIDAALAPAAAAAAAAAAPVDELANLDFGGSDDESDDEEEDERAAAKAAEKTRKRIKRKVRTGSKSESAAARRSADSVKPVGGEAPAAAADEFASAAAARRRERRAREALAGDEDIAEMYAEAFEQPDAGRAGAVRTGAAADEEAESRELERFGRYSRKKTAILAEEVETAAGASRGDIDDVFADVGTITTRMEQAGLMETVQAVAGAARAEPSATETAEQPTKRRLPTRRARLIRKK